ncbi:unnamed protein product [Linum tenue]|uniref:Uncharacterized protein n=1 Tax=Linum tenue TaxID=586396 RepID=A0AAV0NLR6_9ROSI|nr:unnamed protein product [Linum tenue]
MFSLTLDAQWKSFNGSRNMIIAILRFPIVSRN